MLTRIRNAILVGKTEVSLPYSDLKNRVAKVLVDSGFLTGVKETKGDDGRKALLVSINPEGTNSTITEIARLSSPGRRLYVKSGQIPSVKRGRGIVVISTSAGIMTGEQAKAKRLGGELICKVY